jgi:ribonuclease E
MDNDQSSAPETATPMDSEPNSSAEQAPRSAPSKSSRSGNRSISTEASSEPASDGPVGGDARNDVELPDKISEGRPSAEASERALVRKPRIGDTMPIPNAPPPGPAASGDSESDPGAGAGGGGAKRRRRGGRGKGAGSSDGGGNRQSKQQGQPKGTGTSGDADRAKGSGKKKGRGRGRGRDRRVDDDALIEQRKGRERNGKPVGRYFMGVQVRPGMAQVAVLEGRSLIEHYVSRPADDVSQIHGNIYMGKVQNVLPGMEAAFVDIATPKNAVLYRSDVQYDPGDIEVKGKNPRIEDILKNKQMILCQVTKNPIAHKGARLTQEISLPGRFVVLIPNSKTYGISKRLPDDVRKRLRDILDRVKPDEHGVIVRTAAEHATEDELVADMKLLLDQWKEIETKAAKAQRPTLLSREPELAVRVIREEFSADYRGVVIDDKRLYEELRNYVTAFNPELADRIEYYDSDAEGLSLFERYHVHEQVHKALDRKVWLPSGGSLIIEHTEALTVIDVNTGKNVGKSNLEETVFHNNMEAAEEVAKQLRLRDIGGIIVIDFIDMEIKENRAKVVGVLRDALARDKTRSQVFDIGELGLVEMTRKRIGEGLLTEYSEICPDCDGRGVQVDFSMLE